MSVARPAPASTWWGRNWKWFVPVLAALLLALFAAFVLAIVGLVFGAMKSSEPYRHAVASAQANAAVTSALGTPLQTGWFVQGNISTTGAGGEAELAIPLQGPRAGGTLYVEAEKSAGAWRYDTLAVSVDGTGERIELEGDGAHDAD